MKKIAFTIIGVLLTSHSLFTWVTSLKKQIFLFENGLAADFIVEQILSLCHLMSIILFLLGAVALYKAVFYFKR